MKKTFYILALAAIALSCTKEMETSNPAVSGEKVTIKVALAEDDATKVAFTEAADKKSMSLAWESTDKISINGSEFTIKSGFTAHEAEFEGTAPSSSPYTIIYPGKYADAAAFNARSYAGQEQTGNSSTAHLEYNAMLSGVSEYEAPKFDSDWATDKGGSLVQNAVVQMRLQLPDGASNPTSVSLIATNDIFPTTNAGTDLTNEMTLSLKNVTLPTNRILEAYMMVSAAGVTISAGEVLTVAVVTPDATYVRDITLSAQTWNGGGQYTLQLKNFNVHNFDINDVNDLKTFRDGVNSGDILWQTVHANLTTDLDLSGETSWTPIGNGTFDNSAYSVAGNTFRGVFDGGNHVLQNFQMNGTPSANAPYGFFGILDGATVKNLVFGASSGDSGFFKVTPSGIMEAGIVAGVARAATIQNVTNYSPMSILENNSTGTAYFGMVGYVLGTSVRSHLDNVDNYGEVNAHSGNNTANGATGVQVAGIAGFSHTTGSSIKNLIENCDNHGDMTTSTGRVAGILAAANSRTILSNCVNRGNIMNTCANARVGGVCVIIGDGGSMANCSNYGNVVVTKSDTHVGGLVCLINKNNITVSGGGNHGLVVGDITTYRGTLIANINTFASVDGLVAGGAVANYNGGDYTYPAVLTSANYMSYIGMIKAGNESKVTNITFEAWDGYPAANETKISNVTELQAFVAKVNNGEFAATDVAKLTADIDCSSITSWTPIGNVSMSAWTHANLTTSGKDFSGTFDGQGHTIRNLAMTFASSGSYKAYGFFGSIGDGATVKNIVFDSSCSMSISASFGGAFGMLAGLVKGATIENIENHGAITGGGTSSLANGANGRCAIGAIIGEVHPSGSPASLTGLHNYGDIGSSESIFNANKNVQANANAVHVGGIAGFSTNTSNATTVSFTNCINDGDIYTNAGRASGLIAACNRYTKLKGCTNNGDQTNSYDGTCRLGNITCIAGAGSSFEDVCNKGDLVALKAVSVAGVVCLVSDASVQLKNTSSLGATIIGKSVNLSGSQTYNGVLFGYCNVDANFSNCSINGKIGTSTTDLVTLTSENYFQYAGQATSKATEATTTNITFASE
jgi:hypothetical protein